MSDKKLKKKVSFRVAAAAVFCLFAAMPVFAGESSRFADCVRVPHPVEHGVNTRSVTMVSSIAVAPGGRIWATWYAGVSPAEDHNNYAVLATSADGGETWREILVADPDGRSSPPYTSERP